jgi:VanZ family protein
MLPKIRTFTIYWLPLIGYCVFIYVQSSYPTPERIPTFEFSDKLLHFGAYAVMGILFYRAYQTLPLRDNIQALVLLSMISAALYGISDEIHQSFVADRHGSLSDAIADILGGICGVYAYNRWIIARNDRKERSRNTKFDGRKVTD